MKDVQDTSSGSRRTSISLEDCGPDVLQLAMNYTSDYLDYVENLPFDLQRNVTKLREVDQKCREYVKEMEQLYDNFMKEDNGVPSVRRRSYLLQIRRLFGLCKELGDEKISILQSVSEAIESRNKQLEHDCKRFKYAYEPCMKTEHNGKKDKDSRSDSTRGNKRSRRQRNNNSAENKEKNQQQYSKDPEKFSKTTSCDDADEPPPKVMLSSSSPDHSSPAASSVPALTRSALREEDKRAASRSKDKKDEKYDKDTEQNSSTAASGKGSNETAAATTSSMATTSSTTNTSSTSKTKTSNVAILSSSTAGKTNSKGKKKKRKSNKLQTEKQVKNSGEVSPIIDIPIDPDEPTYCLCQQVSFGQMIGCDNLKCPIEWFHFSCVRLTTKPKGKWYCPDCTIKRKREGKRTDNR